MAVERSEAGYALTLEYSHPLLRAVVVGGEDTRLVVTSGYWLRIAEEVRKSGAKQLLVVDRMQGEVMSDADLLRFFELIDGQGLENTRIAYVEGRVDQFSRIEYAEQLALERGYVIRMFCNEEDALLWLRHGAR